MESSGAILLLMVDEAKNEDLGDQAIMNEAWSLTAPRDSLTKEPALATLMLRLGAAVNAIRALQRWSLACREASGVAAQRDLIWSFLAATAYLKEAMDGLLRPHYQDIVRLAREDGTPEAAIKSLGQLLCKKRHNLYARVLSNARNKLVFHWEQETFEQWAEHHSNPTVLELTKGDATNRDQQRSKEQLEPHVAALTLALAQMTAHGHLDRADGSTFRPIVHLLA